MDPKLGNILYWKKGRKMPPITLELFPTFYCNQSCIFCPRKDLEKEETTFELSDGQLLKIISEAAELGIKKIDLIGGGEPFRREICIELVKRIKEEGMDGYLNTNFSLPTEENLRQLVENGWDYIKISLHMPNRKHDLITNNKGAFKKVIRNIKVLNRYKKKLGSEKPVLELGPVLFNGNYKHIKGFIRLASKLNVQNVFFQPVIQYSGIKKYKLTKEQNDFLQKNLKNYESLAKRLDVNINLKSLLKNELIEKSDNRQIKKEEGVYCYEPWLHLTIWPNGTYASCSFPQIKERGVLENRSLKEVWLGNYFLKLRKKLEKGVVPEHCKRCVANVVFNNIKLKEQMKNGKH